MTVQSETTLLSPKRLVWRARPLFLLFAGYIKKKKKRSSTPDYQATNYIRNHHDGWNHKKPAQFDHTDTIPVPMV